MGIEQQSGKNTITIVPVEIDLGRPQSYCLVVLGGDNLGHVHLLGADPVVLGRADDADIQLNDGGVSRYHARIVRAPDGDGLEIVDMGSRNGVYLNSELVQGRQPIRPGDRLKLGLETVFRVCLEDDEETRYARTMFDAALRDGLTGVFNRRHFEDHLSAELAFALRHETTVTLLMLDIDHFKSINDRWEHRCGDAVLKQLAGRVEQMIRTEDVLARYGGEEFAIICRDIRETGGAVLAERVRASVRGAPFEFEAVRIPATVSIGVATFPLHGLTTRDALVSAADKALYRAKSSGRDKVVRFSSL